SAGPGHSHSLGGDDSFRGSSVPGAGSDGSAVDRVPDELSYAGHLLGRTADAAQPHSRGQPRPDLDSSRVSFYHYADAADDAAAGGVHYLPHGADYVLAQH